MSQVSPQVDRRTPLVTIGMPTFNRGWSLDRVMASMYGLDYDKKRIRLCFVDNMSTDATMKIIESFRTEHGSEYESVIIVVAESNISQARNAAFEKAKGTDFIFFLDSDITVPPDTIKRLLANFVSDPRVGIASLPWDNRNARKRAGLLYGAFAAPPGPHPAYKVGNGCNIVSMKAYEEVGGFNEKLRVHEDGEFCYRMRRKGFRIVCDFSSEGTHLRDINVDPGFYLSFMKDSAHTYRELIKRGSVLHAAKVLLSFMIIASFITLVLFPVLSAGLAFAALLVLGIWLNSLAIGLDDGIHVRLQYRPVVGVLFTAATIGISLILLLRFVSGRPK